MTHPFTKRQFRHISLNSASAVRASEKSSIITNRKLTMHFPLSHRWTLCVTPKSPKEWLKGEFLLLALPFISSLQVIIDTSHLVCGLNISSPSLHPWQTVAEMGVITSRDLFQIFIPSKISLERLKLETSNLVCMLIIPSPSLRTTNGPWKGRGHCHVISVTVTFGK